jgi:hypothetical protein
VVIKSTFNPTTANHLLEKARNAPQSDASQAALSLSRIGQKMNHQVLDFNPDRAGNKAIGGCADLDIRAIS